jgi:hypothetical protein
VNIFRSVLKWAESKLSQSKKLITGESRRRIMLQSNIIYMIGIPLLTLEEYTTVVVPSDVLTDKEQLCVFKAITMKNNSDSKITTKFRMRPRKGGNIINLSVDAMLYSRSNSIFSVHGITINGDNHEAYENMYIKALAAVRIVSAVMKPRYQNRIQNSRVTCIVDGKTFQGVDEHGKSLILEINRDVLSNETLLLQFAVDDDDPFPQCQPAIRMTATTNGLHQPGNMLMEHVHILLDCIGVRLVDSLNIMVLC